MKEWIRAASLPSTVDLAALNQFLLQRGIAHRITEEGGQQVIWVAHADQVEPLLQLLAGLESGAIRLEPVATGSSAGEGAYWPRFWRTLHHFPATYVLLALSIFGALLISWNELLGLAHWFTFQDFALLSGDRVGFEPVAEGLAKGQLWRLITPIFLHFGIFHILFNGLWLWEFGRRIEALLKSWRFLNLVLLIAVCSNVSQYLWQGPSLFGGMSGVIYGLLGYIWQRQRLAPDPRLAIPPGIIGFMLIWLVLCMVGTVSWFSQVRIANAAHLSGLIVGMASGYLAGLQARQRRE